ncbi:hypothetical protein F9B85_10145 [Heliorestis acidaminivorans]|uniref:Uncharacterized protein n=1 Tax=Heliorestis acidaminivorans TaxID=553427 RepID=A0A6I0F1F5_9FIRM|nr:hypothetical protein [Heliorestis acidaminivorans]KAB2952164.1 hypothetical protein F9B85_10145 [Heliorestis acidaminivorans]
MINSYINEYKTLTNKLFPYSMLDFDDVTTIETLESMFNSIEIIYTYVNSTASLDSWITLKLNEVKNQLLISLYYLPQYTEYVFNSFKRSIAELILKITIYSASIDAKTVEYQNSINNIQFRTLKDRIKNLQQYKDSFKNTLDNFFAFYGSSSNNIHLKNSSTIIEYIEAYNSITLKEIKQVRNFVIKVESFLLTIFPKLHNLNDKEFNMPAKIQLKKVLSDTLYKKYFC